MYTVEYNPANKHYYIYLNGQLIVEQPFDHNTGLPFEDEEAARAHAQWVIENLLPPPDQARAA